MHLWENSKTNPDDKDTFCRPMVMPKSFKRFFSIIIILTLLFTVLIMLTPIDITAKLIVIFLITVSTGVSFIFIRLIHSANICVSADKLEIKRLLGGRQSIPLRYIKNARKTTFDEAQLGPKLIKDDTPALFIEIDSSAPFLFKLKYIFRNHIILPTLHAEELAQRIQENPFRKTRWRKILDKKIKKPKHTRLKIAIVLSYLIIIIGASLFLQDIPKRNYFDFFEISVNTAENTSEHAYHARYVNVNRAKNQTGFGWSTHDPDIYDVSAWDKDGPINFTIKRGYIDMKYRRNISKNDSYEFWYTFKQNETTDSEDFYVQGSVLEYRIYLTYLQPVEIQWIEPAADEITYDGNLTFKWNFRDLGGMLHMVTAKQAVDYLDSENLDFRFSKTRNPEIEYAKEKYLTTDNDVLKSAYQANYYALLREENRSYIENKLIVITNIAFVLLVLSLLWLTYIFSENKDRIFPIYLFVLFPFVAIYILGYSSIYPILLPYSIAMISLLYSNFSRRNIDIYDSINADSGFVRLLSRLAFLFLIFFMIFAIMGNFPHGFIKYAILSLLLPFILFGTHIYINRDIINRNRLIELIQKIDKIEKISGETFILPDIFSNNIIRIGSKTKSYRFDRNANVYPMGLTTTLKERTVDNRNKFNSALIIIFFTLYLITSYLYSTFGYSESVVSLMLFSILMFISFRL